MRSARTIEAIVKAGIPVMGHIGLTPQAINAIGKVRVQGKTREQARPLLADALAVQEAGAFAVVLELVPASWPRRSPSGSRSRRSASAPAPAAPARSRSSPTARLGRLDAEARAGVRGPARNDPRAISQYKADVEAGTFPGRPRPCCMDPAVLDEVLGPVAPTTGAGAAGLAGIPLDRDL